MSGERVYTVKDGVAEPLTAVNLADAGLRERDDLQEWVISRPEILSPDVLIVAFEFDRWQDWRGERQRDRLDILGLDSGGRLVLVELKRDTAPDTVEMQAIKYAAMASRFTEDDLVRYHARFLTQRGEKTVSEDEARDLLIDHAGELDPKLLRQPRIVLVAGAFKPTTSATVVWLSEMGLDITLQRIQAYRLGDDVIVTVSQLFPVPDVEEFTISPQRIESAAEAGRGQRRRSRSAVHRLVDSGVLGEGASLRLQPTTEVDAETQDMVEEWIAEDPRRGRATWSNSVTEPLTWEYNGQTYRPTSIVSLALQEVTGAARATHGPRWWVTEDGQSLADLAGPWATSAFDWSPLHAVLETMPPGRWTTYGDLATLVGTAPQPLGGHVASCPECTNAFRVLDSRGQTSPGFRWTDPADQRSQQDALEEEGIRFVDGRAAPESRLSPDELTALVAAGT